jgi:hypothetical protein
MLENCLICFKNTKNWSKRILENLPNGYISTTFLDKLGAINRISKSNSTIWCRTDNSQRKSKKIKTKGEAHITKLVPEMIKGKKWSKFKVKERQT